MVTRGIEILQQRDKHMKRPCEKCNSVNTTVCPVFWAGRVKYTLLRCKAADCGHDEIIPKEDDGSDPRFTSLEKNILLKHMAAEDAFIQNLRRHVYP